MYRYFAGYPAPNCMYLRKEFFHDESMNGPIEWSSESEKCVPMPGTIFPKIIK
jgi:hypothetical protein